jgi:hypothetical protein
MPFSPACLLKRATGRRASFRCGTAHADVLVTHHYCHDWEKWRRKEIVIVFLSLCRTGEEEKGAESGGSAEKASSFSLSLLCEETGYAFPIQERIILPYPDGRVGMRLEMDDGFLPLYDRMMSEKEGDKTRLFLLLEEDGKEGSYSISTTRPHFLFESLVPYLFFLAILVSCILFSLFKMFVS